MTKSNTILNKAVEQDENTFDDEKMWNIIRNNAAIEGTPIHGHFELTPKCNMDCKMCYVHLMKNQMDGEKELTLEEWKKIIDEATAAGMIFASLSGGECLSSENFEEIYLYLESKGILITVLTNGVLLKNKIEFFKEHKPVYIQVSVYGSNEDEYERVTGYRYYEKVKQGIENAIECGLPVGIAVTASKLLQDITPIVNYYKKKNVGVTVNSWLMPPYESTGRKIDSYTLTPKEQVKISLDLLLSTDQKIPESYEGEIPSANKKSSKNIQKGITCAAGRSDFSISWKGNMSMCVSLHGVTGAPLVEGFNRAWEKTKKAAKEFQLPMECFECVYKKVCNRCPAEHLMNSEYGHCSSLICEEMELMLKAGLITL